MTVFYIHRREDGSIASAHGRLRPGYAEEIIDSAAPELAAFLAKAESAPPLTVEALANALEKKGHLTKGDIDAERGKK